MKKWMLFILSALLLLPLGAAAESLPEVLSAVSAGIEEGLKEGLMDGLMESHPQDLSDSLPTQPQGIVEEAEIPVQSTQSLTKDLTLLLSAESARIEEGSTITLCITAGNPYPEAADVTFALDLPKRLSCAKNAVWQATLPPAKQDPQTGAFIPSVTLFTREITLTPGSGAGEQTDILLEMNMGTRFYRAQTALELCVPVISASAALEGTMDGLIQPGEPFSLVLSVVNDGNAAKDVPYSLVLPDGVKPSGALPEGTLLRGQAISGAMRAEAGASASVSLPLTTDDALLDGDKDASRMIAAVASIDGKRIPAPMLNVVGPMISAKLIPETDSLEEGDMVDLTITVVNSGLAPADIELSCLLPRGLSVVSAQKEEETATQAEIATVAEALSTPPTLQGDGALVYALHMDAAVQTDAGIAAATKEIRLRVRADEPADDTKERLLGATLAWRTNGGDMQLSEAAAMRVRDQGFLGLGSGEWNGILLAALLMVATICCLYSACRSGKKEDDYCFD